MRLPLHIWAPVGKEAWRAGQRSIKSGEFVFEYTPDDNAYADLRKYAMQQAKQAIARLDQHESGIAFTPAEKVQLTLMYTHAFVNGAFDQILSEMPPTP